MVSCQTRSVLEIHVIVLSLFRYAHLLKSSVSVSFWNSSPRLPRRLVFFLSFMDASGQHHLDNIIRLAQ